MRKRSYVLIIACLAGSMLLSACHGASNYTQTFVSESDSGRSLKLKSPAGFIRPAAEFPHNIMFKLFGTDELTGTYERIEGAETSKGTFVAGKEGDEQWIRLTSEDKKEWRLTVKPGGSLEGDGETWKLTTLLADAKATSEIKFGK